MSKTAPPKSPRNKPLLHLKQFRDGRDDWSGPAKPAGPSRIGTTNCPFAFKCARKFWQGDDGADDVAALPQPDRRRFATPRARTAAA